MLPFRHIGTPKPDQWLGLVDAVYAIAMTVLALLLPDMLGDSFKLFETKQDINYLFIGFYQVGIYLFGLLILYEIWCFHRSILVVSTGKNRKQNIYTGLMLGIICLTPPWAGAIFKDVETSHFWVEGRIDATLSTFTWLLIGLMYFLLFLIARSAEDFRSMPDLKIISKETKNRSIFFAFAVAFHSIRIFDKQFPFVPALLILAVYVLISFNQDQVTGVLRAIPKALRQR